MIPHPFWLFVLSGTTVACTGTLGRAQQPDRCVELDDRRQFAGAIGKGAAALAAVSGVAALPVDEEDKALRYSVAGGAVLAGAVAAGAMVVAEGASESWSRECSE